MCASSKVSLLGDSSSSSSFPLQLWLHFRWFQFSVVTDDTKEYHVEQIYVNLSNTASVAQCSSMRYSAAMV